MTKPKKQSTLERAFLTRWDQAVRDLVPRPPDPVFQCYFHPERDWVFDFGWVSSMVLLDLQGGGWLTGSRRGGHSRELGMANDCAKHNAALVLGWRPFLATTSMIDNDPQAVIAPILELLKQPVLSPHAERYMWTARLRNLTHVGAVITNNGIRVLRMNGAKFTVTFAKGDHVIRAKRLADARQQVLDLILTNERTPKSISVVEPEPISSATNTAKATPAPVIVVGITEATQKAYPAAPIPVPPEKHFNSPPLKPEDDIANYFKKLTSAPRMARPEGSAAS